MQRCILNALTADGAIYAQAFQPNSFGGIPRRKGHDTAGVQAAISSLLHAISEGCTHVMITDIEGFFTKISKADCAKMSGKFVDDRSFMELFENAIAVDLENVRSVWKHKKEFPYGDIGVAQGNCLSPFLGNLILSEFDQIMNEGDCRCIRYIDDVIIVAPSGKAASSRFRNAVKLLNQKGMNFARDKTTDVPIPINGTFEYLGIEFQNGLMRPAKKARNSILQRTKDAAAEALIAAKSANNASDFDQKYSIPRTLNRISGMAKGWAQHYTFCNDIQTVKDVDEKMHEIYLAYASKAQSVAVKQNATLAAAILGYTGAASVTFKPLEWPK